MLADLTLCSVSPVQKEPCILSLVTSGGKLFDDPKIAPTKSIEEITAHHAQIRDSLGIW